MFVVFVFQHFSSAIPPHLERTVPMCLLEQVCVILLLVLMLCNCWLVCAD